MYNAKDFTLHGQVAVVTGAGIGRAIAEAFSAAGAASWISDQIITVSGGEVQELE